MPPARRRERDPRTGRYISSRESTEDLGGPSRSVPGAFDEPVETIDQTETAPGASETVEIEPTETTEATVYETAETDETVERTEPDERIQSASGIEIDPSEQLQAELAAEDPDWQPQGEPVSGILGIEESTSGMSGEFEIPAYQAVTPQKIVTFNIEKLDRTNVSSWKAQYKIFLETQGCWSVVGHTYKWRGNATRVRKLLEDPGWRASDATAKLHILQNIKVEDKASVQSLKTSGDMWAFLMEKYERRTQVDVTNAIRKVTRWQMDPKMSLEEAMQQLDQYHAELEDISNGKVKFDSMIILIFFLDGLPSGYDSMKFSLPAQENLTRGMVLSRLQQQESMMITAKENETIQESASRAKQMSCFNCGKQGHFARDCTAPKKNREQSSSREDPQGRGHRKGHSKARGHRNGGDKSRRGHTGRQKGKARTADEETDMDTDADSDSSASSSGSTRNSAHRVYGRTAYRAAENAYRVELKEQISDLFEYLLGEADERAYRLKGSDDPIIDSGATSTCSGKINLFESLDQRYRGSLGTAGKSIEIAGRGTMRIPLSSGKVARIRNALYVPRMTQTLLSSNRCRIWVSGMSM